MFHNLKLKTVRSLLIAIIAVMPYNSEYLMSDKKPEFQVINLSESFFKKGREIFLSQFVDEISFVPLETKSNLSIGSHAQYEVTDDFIIVRNVGLSQNDQILLFSRTSGIFLREIGKKGRGPGEYTSCGSLPFNKEKKEIYALGPSDAIMIYDIQGLFKGKVTIPSWTDHKVVDKFWSKVSTSPVNLLDKDTFAGYVSNFTGWEKRKIILFNKDSILNVFPNCLEWSRTDWNSVSAMKGTKFYRWNNKLNFIELFCDTLYEVTKTKMIPRYFFDLGKFQVQYSKQSEIWDLIHRRQPLNYLFIEDIIENNNFLFVQLLFNNQMFTGSINKSNNKISFSTINNFGISGFKDDIGNLMDVVPNSITENNEIIYIIQSPELMKWLATEPQKASDIRARYKWIKTIDEFSNPIIAIAKCKD